LKKGLLNLDGSLQIITGICWSSRELALLVEKAFISRLKNYFHVFLYSVADPGCLSWIQTRPPYPGSGSYKKAGSKNKLTFFMQDKVKIEVIFFNEI
jgi:hypothetical protein